MVSVLYLNKEYVLYAEGLIRKPQKNWPDPNLYLIVQQLKCPLQNCPQKKMMLILNSFMNILKKNIENIIGVFFSLFMIMYIEV